jgi:hypothetical protein
VSRPELTEEQLRAIEEQMAKLTPDDIMLDALVSLINLGARKARPDLPPGPQEGRDLEQARQAIDGARALVAQVESRHAAELGQVREALAQLQMAYVQLGGGAPPAPAEGAPKPPEGDEAPAEQPKAGEPGPAQRSGRLWVPGQ